MRGPFALYVVFEQQPVRSVGGNSAVLLGCSGNNEHCNERYNDTDECIVELSFHDLCCCAADKAEDHTGNDTGSGDDLLVAECIGKEYRAGKSCSGVCIGCGEPGKGIGPNKAHKYCKSHENCGENAGDGNHLGIFHVGLCGGDDVTGDIGNRSLDTGRSGRHHGCEYERCEQSHKGNGKLAHEPCGGAVADFGDALRNGNGAECKTHVDSPYMAQDGEQSRDFIYVKDIAEANIRAAESDYNGVVNVALGKSMTINHLFEVIKDVLDSDIEVKHVEERPGDIKHSLACIDNLKNIGFQPDTDTFEKHLRETVEWFKTQL